MVLHSEINDTNIARSTTAPAAAPSFVGEAYFEDNAISDVGRCLRIANGTSSPADFVVVGFVPQGGSGGPNGTFTSRCLRDLYINDIDNTLWYSQSAGSNSSWVQIAGGSGGGGGS